MESLNCAVADPQHVMNKRMYEYFDRMNANAAKRIVPTFYNHNIQKVR